MLLSPKQGGGGVFSQSHEGLGSTFSGIMGVKHCGGVCDPVEMHWEPAGQQCWPEPQQIPSTYGQLKPLQQLGVLGVLQEKDPRSANSRNDPSY